jgi:uncharacterized membrane protein YedE/YeeE
MFESLGLDGLTPRAASLLFGGALGLVFGALALATGFCLRRAIAGDREERAPALGLWLVALASAVAGTQAAAQSGLIAFAGHRLLAEDLPVLAIVLGGLMFGAGMVLARGCASRLTVLAGSGNLRAALVMLVFAVVALATVRGALAPLRTAIGGVTLSGGGALPGGALLWVGLAVTAAGWAAWRGGLGLRGVVGGIAIGLLVPLGWVGTGFVLLDEFEPIPMESLSFAGPWAETLFWSGAASAVPAGFGVGLVGGTLAGSLVLALATRSFRWQSFSAPAETGRYLAGGAMMGFGGVLAGGCTVGAGLAGLPTLGTAATLALAAIVAGGWAADRALSARPSAARGYDAQGTTRQGLPAE